MSQEGDRPLLNRMNYWATLRGRITLVSVLALALVTVALVFSSQSGQQRTFEQLSRAKLTSDRLMFDKVAAYQLSVLEERLTHIITPPLVEAFRDENMPMLREYALPPFNRLSSLINMTKLSFYRTPDAPLLSAHQSISGSSVRASRTLISEAFAHRAIRMGLERVDGGVDLTVAWPVYGDGVMVGIVAVSGALKPVLEELKKTLDAELALVTNDTHDGSVQVLVHSGEILPANLFGLISTAVDTLAHRPQAGVQLRKDSEGKHWEAHLSPVTSSDGQQIGWLWVGRDASGMAERLVRNTAVDVLVAVSVTAAALTLILFNVARVFGGLDRMVAAIQQFSHGKRDVTIPPSKDDEVGRLGAALQQMIHNVGETQQQLERSEREAKAASTAKSNFIANISHELRTPLNAILGYADLLREDLASHGLERSVADISRIHDAARSLLNIINDLLDIAKLDSGKLQVESSPVRVGALLREIEQELGEPVRRNGNQFIVQVDEPDENVLADPARLKQALRNVIQNAGKFTHQGKVEVRVYSGFDQGEQIRFVVRDTGIGMPAEALPQLFKPFSQVDGSMSRKFGGLGVGLAISRALCELMGGHLHLETQPGAGTMVTLTLPRAQPIRATSIGRRLDGIAAEQSVEGL